MAATQAYRADLPWEELDPHDATLRVTAPREAQPLSPRRAVPPRGTGAASWPRLCRVQDAPAPVGGRDLLVVADDPGVRAGCLQDRGPGSALRVAATSICAWRLEARLEARRRALAASRARCVR